MERTSRDCFTNGGALAEVMTLYENMLLDSPSDSMESDDLTEHRSQQMVVKVIKLATLAASFENQNFLLV